MGSDMLQLPLTADRFFAKDTALLIQKIPLDAMVSKGGEVKWEDSHGSVFPHFYYEPLEDALVGLGELNSWSKEGDATWVETFGDTPQLE